MSNITVEQKTQRIIVDVASKSVSVINAGPVGPRGPVGEVSTTQLNIALDGKLSKTGGTMTGPLIVSSPAFATHAANKQYVDGAVAYAVEGKLSTTGGTVNGQILLEQEPLYPLSAVTKLYVDTAIAEAIAEAIAALGGVTPPTALIFDGGSPSNSSGDVIDGGLPIDTPTETYDGGLL